MNPLRVHVDGIGLWSPQLANFDAWRRWLAGDETVTPATRPGATILSPNERRRAPEGVLVAIEAAQQAVAMSPFAAAELACVFASAYGDQATTDYMCRVLAAVPTELSPTRFHNAVHNAAAGYWTIATHSRAPSSAISGGHASFGAGLLEAAVQVSAEGRPVLFVCSDTKGIGPLGDLTGCAFPFGCALVLSPAGKPTTPLRLHPVSTAPEHAPLPAACTNWMQQNPSATALPLLAMLARGTGECVVAASGSFGLHLQWETSA